MGEWVTDMPSGQTTKRGGGGLFVSKGLEALFPGYTEDFFERPSGVALSLTPRGAPRSRDEFCGLDLPP